MTLGEYLNKNNKEFVKYGYLARWFEFIGKIYYKLFGSFKYMDKSVYYLDKRWEIICLEIEKLKK